MNTKQRVVLILGGIGILHSSMVPPVSQLEGEVCRYREFVERSLLFTRQYGVDHGDLVALLSEYGVIAALTCIAYLALGSWRPGVPQNRSGD